MTIKTGDKITILTTEEHLTIGKEYLVEDMFDGLVVITDDDGNPSYIQEENLY